MEQELKVGIPKEIGRIVAYNENENIEMETCIDVLDEATIEESKIDWETPYAFDANQALCLRPSEKTRIGDFSDYVGSTGLQVQFWFEECRFDAGYTDEEVKDCKSEEEVKAWFALN